MQVALNQIIDINNKRLHDKLYNLYCDRSIDFVLYNKKTKKIIACIELNGNSHDKEERKARDKYLREVFEFVPIPLIFIKSQEKYNQEEIKQIIEYEIKNKKW